MKCPRSRYICRCMYASNPLKEIEMAVGTFTLDAILVPLSLFVLIVYHVYFWCIFKTKPSHTIIGIMSMRRRIWFLDIVQGDGSKAMFAVQNLRNTQMVAILTASIAIVCSLALAALANNAYNASHLFVEATAFFGVQSGRIFALKYGLAYFPLLFSSLCSSMATGFMIDTIYLLDASTESSSSELTLLLFERGYLLAQIGKRLLSISFVLLLWLLGPVPVALSSLALVWWLKESDFVG